LYDLERHREHRYIYGGHDPGVCARMTGGAAAWLLGYPEKGLAGVNEARELAECIAHPFSREVALEYTAALHALRGEPEAALVHLEAAAALRAEQRVSFAINPLFLRAATELARDAPDRAIALVREGIAPGQAATIWVPYGLSLLAEALTRRGHCAEALAALAQGFERIEATGERGWEAELHRINGLALLAENRSEEAQEAQLQALRVAGDQQAKSLELRAATDLARLWGEKGRRTEAHELLAPVYGWFTEGFDTADLKDAKGLLDELA
jgi:predicted ATPase